MAPRPSTIREFGPGAVVGTAKLDGQDVTLIVSDAQAFNEKFPVVYAGIIGMEEGYKMAQAVYASLAADADKPKEQKRALVLIVDTPGNGPGKVEEIFGMNKATGAYQLALAEARLAGPPDRVHGHRPCDLGRLPVPAGLQGSNILSLDSSFGTMIHVMPLTSISRIIKKDLETLEALSKGNPVFAAGPQFFYALGGVEEQISKVDGMRPAIIEHIKQIRAAVSAGEDDKLGPWGRGTLGAERNGRVVRPKVINLMNQEFAAVAEKYAPSR